MQNQNLNNGSPYQNGNYPPPSNYPQNPYPQNHQSKTLANKPTYYKAWFIALMAAFWFFIVPGIIAIVLSIMAAFYEKEAIKQYQMIEDANQYKLDIERDCALRLQHTSERQTQMLEEVNQYKIGIERDCEMQLQHTSEQQTQMIEAADKNRKGIEEQIVQLNTEKATLCSELQRLEGDVLVASVTVPSVDESITSEEYKSKFKLLTLKEKELVQQGSAVQIMDSTISKKVIGNDVKQLLRCFNSETDTHIRSITVRNIETVKSRIIKTYETLNKLFETDGVRINHSLVEIKLEEADLMYSFEYQKEQERMQQKAIREQMIEEEKVRREIEKEKAKVEKEEAHFKNEIDKLMAHLRAASDIEKQLYVDKIRELEDKLKVVEESKKNVLNREQNTRAGYVYIISNIGSFGEDVYKIGMTRRLDPMDRVNELGSASVPFEFDVHAMIFSEDAPALEATLHNAFQNQRVNMVNRRKEFFRVSLQEIERVVKENFNATVQFTMVAEAAQYRESQKMLEKQAEAIPV